MLFSPQKHISFACVWPLFNTEVIHFFARLTKKNNLTTENVRRIISHRNFVTNNLVTFLLSGIKKAWNTAP